LAKKRMLVLGIIMNCAGTEKSFISFAQNINCDEWEVDLMLAHRTGQLIDSLPKEINIIDFPDRDIADMFLLSSKNAVKTIWNCFIRHNPLTAFEVLPYFVKLILNPKKRADTATRMWCDLMKKHASEIDTEYDVAAAYWGDRTMFYMCDKIKAKKKLAWLHFDYGNPPRDDELYLSYFKKCDAVVTVSEKINDSLTAYFPEIASKCLTIENINDPAQIRALADAGESFDDGYTGKRLLSIGRISEQKGFDIAVDALKILKDAGYDLRLYIVGTGDESDIAALRAKAKEREVSDMLVLLGVKMNPYPYLRDCDIYIQPSRYEGKPITVEEAKMMQKPIVVANYISASEQLENGHLGMIVPIDADALAKGIMRLYDDPALAEEYTKRLSERDFSNRSEIEKFYGIVK